MKGREGEQKARFTLRHRRKARSSSSGWRQGHCRSQEHADDHRQNAALIKPGLQPSKAAAAGTVGGLERVKGTGTRSFRLRRQSLFLGHFRLRPLSTLEGRPGALHQRVVAVSRAGQEDQAGGQVALAPGGRDVVVVLEHGRAELVVVGVVPLEEDQPARRVDQRLGGRARPAGRRGPCGRRSSCCGWPRRRSPRWLPGRPRRSRSARAGRSAPRATLPRPPRASRNSGQERGVLEQAGAGGSGRRRWPGRRSAGRWSRSPRAARRSPAGGGAARRRRRTGHPRSTAGRRRGSAARRPARRRRRRSRCASVASRSAEADASGLPSVQPSLIRAARSWLRRPGRSAGVVALGRVAASSWFSRA